MWRPISSRCADPATGRRRSLIAACAIATSGWSAIWAAGLFALPPAVAVLGLLFFVGGLGAGMRLTTSGRTHR